MKILNILIISLFLFSCSKSSNSLKKVQKKEIIVTTLYAYDLVKTLLGSDFESVDYLLGPGTDPHIYKPKPTDLKKVRLAELIIYHGPHLEGKIANTLEGLRHQGKRVISLNKFAPANKYISEEGGKDPHIWFSPELWSQVATGLAKNLAALYPERKALVQSNLGIFTQSLKSLGEKGRELFKTIPKQKRVLVTGHDAFNYFARYFEIESIGIQGLSTVTEATLRDMEDISKMIKKRGIPTIFLEQSLSPATIEKMSEMTGAKIGGKLYSDSLGDLKSSEGTYLGALEYNIKTIVDGLRRSEGK